MSLASRWLVIRATRETRRAHRARVRRLRRELATYAGPRDRAELDAVLARLPEARTREIRQVVDATRQADPHPRRIHLGPGR